MPICCSSWENSWVIIILISENLPPRGRRLLHGDNLEYHIGYKGDSKDYKLAEGHTQILGTHMMNPHLTNHRPNPLTRSPIFLVATSYRYWEFQPQCLSSTTSYPSEGHGGTIHWGVGLKQELTAGIPWFVLECLPDYLVIVVHIFGQIQTQTCN